MTRKLTTISLTPKQKQKLDKLKTHRREPYFEVLERLLKEAKQCVKN